MKILSVVAAAFVSNVALNDRNRPKIIEVIFVTVIGTAEDLLLVT